MVWQCWTRLCFSERPHTDDFPESERNSDRNVRSFTKVDFSSEKLVCLDVIIFDIDSLSACNVPWILSYFLCYFQLTINTAVFLIAPF